MVGDRPQGVGQQDFLAEAQRKAPHAAEKLVEAERPMRDLPADVVVADDGPGNDVRKGRQVHAEVEERGAARVCRGSSPRGN